MATVIEPGLIGSDEVKRVCALTGMDEDTFTGKLVRLWTSSQKVGKVRADFDQVVFWLNVTGDSHAPKLVTAMCDPLAGFLRKKGKLYEISGNKRHIDKQRAIKKTNTDNALKRWAKEKKPDATRINPASDRDAKPMPNVCLTNLTKPSLPSLNTREEEEKKFPTPKIQNVSPDDFALCLETWKGTLKHFGKEAGNLTQGEELEIARAIQREGGEAIALALLGARHEPKHEGFDPKEFVSLRRIFGKDKQGKDRVLDFVNWGRAAKAKQTRIAERKPTPPPETEVELSPEEGKRRFAEIMAMAQGREMPK